MGPKPNCRSILIFFDCEILSASHQNCNTWFVVNLWAKHWNVPKIWKNVNWCDLFLIHRVISMSNFQNTMCRIFLWLSVWAYSFIHNLIRPKRVCLSGGLVRTITLEGNIWFGPNWIHRNNIIFKFKSC